MIIIGFRPAKLIVGDRWSGTVSRWSAKKILQLSAPPVIAHQNVQLTVGTEPQNAAVMIAAELLIRICLEGAQLDQIAIESSCRTIPNVPVDAIAERRHFSD